MGDPSGKLKPVKRKPHYSAEIIDQALLALAYTRGSRTAREQLRMAGVSPLPDDSTIRSWKRKYSGRLAELTERHGADIERHIVSGYMDIITASQEAVTESIEKAQEAVREAGITVEDGKRVTTGDARMITALSGAARNFATVYGITQEKIQIIHGKPTQIIGKEKDTEEALRSLARFRVDAVDSDVEPTKELES